jgi:hypothetical protein
MMFLSKKALLVNEALILIGVLVFLSGCTPLERAAYSGVVGAKAALVQFRSQHPECAFDATTGLSANVKSVACTANNRLTAAKDAIIDAAEVYCSGTTFETGGACNPPAKGTNAYTESAGKLKAAIASYNQIQKDVAVLLKGGAQ